MDWRNEGARGLATNIQVNRQANNPTVAENTKRVLFLTVLPNLMFEIGKPRSKRRVVKIAHRLRMGRACDSAILDHLRHHSLPVLLQQEYAEIYEDSVRK
jgi:hypothetical protein